MPSRISTTLPYTEKVVADGNFDTSRAPIDRIIIHTMVGTADSAANRFATYGTQVSAHYGVKLDGSLYHFLEETYTAYHTGDYAMNQRSIGIEHEDNGDYNGVRTDALYTESANLVRDICQFYNIPIDRQHILKHNEVIATGCPDALDIDRIVQEAANIGPMVSISQKELDQLRIDRDTNWNLYQAEKQKNTDLQTALDKCNQDLSTCQSSSQTPSVPTTPPIENPSTPPVELPTVPTTLETPPVSPSPEPKLTFLEWIKKVLHDFFVARIP